MSNNHDDYDEREYDHLHKQDLGENNSDLNEAKNFGIGVLNAFGLTLSVAMVIGLCIFAFYR